MNAESKTPPMPVGGANSEHKKPPNRTADAPQSQHGEQPFSVHCTKYDGRSYLFNRYATLAEAEAVARTLRSVGCSAFAEGSS
jgi:hypothetical protein